jgi:arylsulfatase A
MKTLVTLFLLLTCGVLAADKPNLIVIMADDFGYECVTANGGQSYQTPNLDRMAAEGARFEHCHVLPLCTPTRVQLMTGRYNVRNYLEFGTLLREERTFGNLLQEAGYATAVCGKWQLGKEADSPQHFGFTESYLWQGSRRPARYANPGLEHNGKELDFTQGEYGPKLVNDFALDFITRHKDAPFFLYYPMMLTHDPYQPTPDSPDWDPKRTGESSGKDVKHFAEMVAYMDKLIGALHAKLSELGLREKTLVLFLGDNGTGVKAQTQFRGQTVRGGKGTTTHRGTHVPLIASWPSSIPAGQTHPDLISGADILPTLLEAAGAPVPNNLDGVSFLPRLRGQKHTPREWLYVWYSPRPSSDATVKEYAFDHRHKLYGTGEFYDLQADPEEKMPLSLTPDADKLKSALALFQDARPAALDAANSKGKKKDTN